MASQQKYPHLACLHRDEGHENSDACLCPNHFAELNRKLLMETCPMANLGDESAIFWRRTTLSFVRTIVPSVGRFYGTRAVIIHQPNQSIGWSNNGSRPRNHCQLTFLLSGKIQG